MAEKRRFLDVWIVETNTVYREVPFTVVADWVQQGRLLEDDMLRPSGTAQWFKVGAAPDFHAYLPHPEPFRADDQAEALEPVQLDFAWKRRPPDDDEDVDMIPLIDISLVLLIFFMMTATVVVGTGFINTPEADFATTISADSNMLWIGIDRDRADEPVYSLGQGNLGPAEGDRKLTESEVLNRLDDRLQGLNGPVGVRIAADQDLRYEIVQRLTIELEKRRAQRKIDLITAEVSDQKP
jgi:biopolymer transport protein ExbD